MEKKWNQQALPPKACRCCQRAEPVLHVTQPNIVTLILWLYHPAARELLICKCQVKVDKLFMPLAPFGLVTPHLDWLNEHKQVLKAREMICFVQGG